MNTNPDLLEIGEAARAGGVSPRMLRHWEEVELLVPASTDPASGRRRYAPTQVERIRQIARLRAEGLDLARVRTLLDPGLRRDGLVGLLQEPAAELDEEQRRTAERREEVQRRLDGLEEAARQVARTARLEPVPERALRGVRCTVHDEREIGAAAARLHELWLEHVGSRPDDLVQVYDGRQPGVIGVMLASGSAAGHPGLEEVVLAAEPLAVSVIVDPGLVDEADLWVLVDDHLATKGLTTHGTHWRRSRSEGRVQLCAGVLPPPAPCISKGDCARGAAAAQSLGDVPSGSSTQTMGGHPRAGRSQSPRVRR